MEEYKPDPETFDPFYTEGYLFRELVYSKRRKKISKEKDYKPIGMLVKGAYNISGGEPYQLIDNLIMLITAWLEHVLNYKICEHERTLEKVAYFQEEIKERMKPYIFQLPKIRENRDEGADPPVTLVDEVYSLAIETKKKLENIIKELLDES